jgi:hypothetical protein
MHVAQDFFVAFARIPQQLADLQIRETAAQVFQTRDGQQVIVDIGRRAGADERPKQEQAIVDQVEGFGLVAVMVFALGLGRLLGLWTARFGRIRVRARAVGAGVVNVSCLWVAGSGKAAVLSTGVRVAGTAFLARFPGRAGAFGGRQ